MKICVAQIKSEKGAVKANVEKHLAIIEAAAGLHADALFFPELSLTGYEPELAKILATGMDDVRFEVFQQCSDRHQLTIAVGMPILSNASIYIGMLIFQPGKHRQLYQKQMLHEDEVPYFASGTEQLIMQAKDVRVAPAICYESLQSGHVANCAKLGMDIYVASVAKSKNGVDKANQYFPKLAKQYNVPVLMSNCVGYCDNFLSCGNSAIWSCGGELYVQMNDSDEGFLMYDTVLQEVQICGL